MTSTILDTPLAVVEAVTPHRIEVRLKDGVRVDVVGLAAILAARRQLARERKPSILVIAPEDLDFELSIMLTDHHANADAGAYTRAMAIIYPGILVHRLVQLYLSRRAKPFPYGLFQDRKEAEQWLDQREQETD